MISEKPLTLPVFFFQAEDGIRDSSVTGVQTCALPISWGSGNMSATRFATANLRRSRVETVQLRNRNRGLAAATNTEVEMIGTSSAALRVFDTIRRTAPTDANVLILGENGTGKELVAREIHRHSRRAEEVFLRVDLGSLSPQLFDSQ